MRSAAWTRWVGTGLGLVGGFILGYALVTTSGIKAPGSSVIITLTTLEGLIFTYLGTPYVLGGWRGMNARLAATPIADLLAGLLGMIVGLVLAVLIGFFVREFPYGFVLSAVLAVLLAATGASVGLTRRTELVSIVGGKPASHRRVPAAVLDTSVIIDGRILDVARTGFVDIPIILTRSVLKELQYVADSADPIRRGRGRRGLDILTELQKETKVQIQFVDDDTSGNLEIDARLVRLAKKSGFAIMTNDFNLNRVARIEGVDVLNLNELANAMKQIAIPGEEVSVLVVKDGKEPNQGIGYLDDGTMVVVENGKRFMNQSIPATVTSVLQTAAGRMIFAAPAGESSNGRRPRRQEQ